MGLFQIVSQWMVAGVVFVAVVATHARPECLNQQCGNLSIPFPFGIGKGCYLNETFEITCNKSAVPPQAMYGNLIVKNISLDGEIRFSFFIAHDCYDERGNPVKDNNPWLSLWSFIVSDSQNKLMAIGCDTYAYVVGYRGDHRYSTGCSTECEDRENVDDSCSGVGCCQVSIPKGLTNITLKATSYNNHTRVYEFNRCSYALIVDENQFNFSPKYLQGFHRETKLPMVVDWAVGEESCEFAQRNKSSFLCKGNSSCDPSFDGPGYRCKCPDGYEGNPYLHDCTDIDECKNPKLNKCKEPGSCQNTPGNYTCNCAKDYYVDDSGKGCIPKAKRTLVVEVALGTSVGFLALLLCISWSCLIIRKRQIAQLREKYFKRNGGDLLQQQLLRREGCGEQVKVFAAEELEKATNSYHDSRIIGQGGQGTVYKGILPDNRTVAIKKSRIGDKSQVEPFINEITVLYQINHRNVVKLLGCCLETPVPLLVYEYVTNGTVFDHIHNVGAGAASFLPWETRFKIATETAEALSYLHSYTSIPIIHRDIKLANILLDEKHTAKVSDFGASRLIPFDQAQVTTIVQGTFGYLDPEYMYTGQLTEKSDVYSFGVVLIEFLTGQKVISYERSEENTMLAMYFVSLMKEDRLLEIVDERMMSEGNVEHLKQVAALAWRCVRVKGEERPSMKEVAHELAKSTHPWPCDKSNLHTEEAEYSITELCNNFSTDGASSSLTGYDSMNNQVAFELEYAR